MWQMPQGLSWLLISLVCSVTFFTAYYATRKRAGLGDMMMVLYLGHHFVYRAIIYSIRIFVNRRTMPITTTLIWLSFAVINGITNGMAAGDPTLRTPPYPAQFAIGLFLFFGGAAMHITSDLVVHLATTSSISTNTGSITDSASTSEAIVQSSPTKTGSRLDSLGPRALRHRAPNSSTTTVTSSPTPSGSVIVRNALHSHYIVPRGGLFDLVDLSCPNYAGEIIQWVGFAIAFPSPASAATAMISACILVPRAMQTHAWYFAEFKNYPRRKALVPYLF